MAREESDAVVLSKGESAALPHTLSATRHLTVSLVDCDPDAGTATLQLHNPEAEPDSTVRSLVEEAVEDVETANERRDTFHLPEKAVPVDASTVAVQRLACRLHEKLQIGDRVWKVSDIAADQVTLTPGRDHETNTLLNKVEHLEYDEPVVDAAEKLNTIDRAL